MRAARISLLAIAMLFCTGLTHAEDVFPLHVSANHHYFEDAKARPFMLHGEAAWSLIAELKREDVEIYLEDRRRRGFNAILVNLIEHRFSTNPPANAYGDKPFKNSPFGLLGEAYFSHAEWVIEQAEKHGLAVFLVPAYLGVNGGEEGWFKAAEAAGPDRMRTYGEAVAHRFSKFNNIVWVLGGDFDAPEHALVSQLALGIASVSPNALQSVHSGRDTPTLELWGRENWLSFDTIYTYADIHKTTLERSKAGLMPVVLLESAYEYERETTAKMVRRNAYGALLGGAAGQFFGNNPIWHFSGPGVFSSDYSWKEALDSPGARSMSVLRAFFDAIPWTQLVPDRDGSITDLEETYAAASSDKRLTVIYADAGSFRIRSNSVPKTSVALWFDPTSGKSRAAAPPQLTGEFLNYTAPADRENSPRSDWLLVIGDGESLKLLRKA